MTSNQQSAFRDQQSAIPCDLCGATAADFVLTTPRLDGPLLRCRECALYFVAKPVSSSANQAQTTQAPVSQPINQNDGHSESLNQSLDHDAISHFPAALEMERLAQRARELALVEPAVEQGETPWRAVTAQERLTDLRRFIAPGRLLEIGCSTGELLQAAQAAQFTPTGIEADAHTSAGARAQGLTVIHGTLCEAQFPAHSFDAITLYHVIEHFPSPSRELRECQRLLPPGGWLVLEAPNIATFWFHLLGARWRQFIPDHLFFFTPATITRLCEQNGFVVREIRNVGKAMSVRLFISRVGRYSPWLARKLATLSTKLGWQERTVRIKLGDVMRVYAQRQT